MFKNQLFIRLALVGMFILGAVFGAPLVTSAFAGNDRGPNTCDSSVGAGTLTWSDTSADYRASTQGEQWGEWWTNDKATSCSGVVTVNANTEVYAAFDFWGREMTISGTGPYTITAIDAKVTGKAYLVWMRAKADGLIGPREPITVSAQRSTGPAGGYEVKDASTVLCEWFDTENKLANASIVNVTIGGDDVIYSAFNIRNDRLNIGTNGSLSETNQAPTGRRVLVCVHDPEENGDGLLFHGHAITSTTT
jgi:hypothetical protein